MFRNMKRKSRVIIASMAIMLAAAGCSGSNGGNGSDAGTGASNGKEGNQATKTITYYGFSEWVTDPGIAPVFEELKQRFESENPGFTVDFQSDPWGTWENKYKVMFASGNAADVFIVNNPDFPTFANGNYLLDIGSAVDSSYFNGFFPGILSMYTWNGANMAIPFTTDARVLWYNKEIFAEAGLDPEKPPVTWNELKEYALQITEATDGRVYGYGMDLGLQEFPAQSLYTASSSNIITVGSDGSITPNVDTIEFRNYLALLNDMKGAYPPDFGTLTHHDAGTLFAQQRVAMVVGGTWVSDQNENMADATFYGQSLVPKFDAGAPNGSFGGGFGIAVSSGTEYPEQAVKLAQLMASADFNAKIMTDVPANDAALAESKFATDPDFGVFMEQIQYARQSQPKTLYYSQIDKAVYDTVARVVMGALGVDEAIAELEAAIEEIVTAQ